MTDDDFAATPKMRIKNNTWDFFLPMPLGGSDAASGYMRHDVEFY